MIHFLNKPHSVIIIYVIINVTVMFCTIRNLCLRAREEGKGKREGKGRGREKEGRGLEGPPISCWHRAPRRVNPALDFCLFVTFVKDNMCVSYYTMR